MSWQGNLMAEQEYADALFEMGGSRMERHDGG